MKFSATFIPTIQKTVNAIAVSDARVSAMFEPLRLGPTEVRNRFVFAAHGTRLPRNHIPGSEGSADAGRARPTQRSPEQGAVSRGRHVDGDAVERREVTEALGCFLDLDAHQALASFGLIRFSRSSVASAISASTTAAA